VKISSLRTPCVRIDQPTIDRNIDRMQQAAEGAGCGSGRMRKPTRAADRLPVAARGRIEQRTLRRLRAAA
jgi:D-serine deaminase-like pyridoxal phosphate-dependent protein